MSTRGLLDPATALAALPAGLSRAAAAVLPALRSAAGRTGADFGALMQMARVESGFRADARAATSSASGLFQFVDSTWLQVLGRHGARNGIPQLPRAQALALRNDPNVASLMAAEHMKDNAATLEASLGRAVDGVDLYFAHFLGAAGASRFLGALEQTPEAYGAALFPAAAKANRSIFYAGGTPRSLADIHGLIAAKLGGGGAARAPASARATQPATLSAALAPTLPATRPAGAEAPAAPAMPPRDAARLAYLLLAEMGG